MTLRLPYVTPSKRQFQQQSVLDQAHTDINLYPNPIPFNSRVGPTQFDIPSIVWVAPPNIALTTVVVTQNPITNTDWSKPFNIPGAPFPYYPNIAIIQPPSIPIDTSSSRSSTQTSSTIYPNLVLQNFSTPFVNLQPFTVSDVVGITTPTPYNINIYTTAQATPVIPIQWGSVFPIANVPANPVVTCYNLNLFGQTLLPFNVPFDVTRTPNFVQQAGSYNLNLYGPTVVGNPFAQLDWPKPSLPQIATPQFAPTNINLFTNPIPFSSYDWSKPRAVKASIDPLYPDLILLQPVGNPFSQLDWSKAYTISPKASNQNDLPNLLLIQPSIPGKPLGINGWIDWSYVKGPVIIVPDQNNLPNIVLFNTTPIPPPPDATPSGKWRWLEGYNDLVKPRNNITGDIKKAAAVLSKMGGHARAQALTSTQRSNIASTAAQARWNPKR